MIAERLMTQILEAEKQDPDRAFYYTRALEACHISLRRGKRSDRGCVPIAITFTHGSSSLIKEHIPLTTQKWSALLRAAGKIATRNSQYLDVLTSLDLTTPDNEEYLHAISAAWVVTWESAAEGHVFGILRVHDEPDCFAVFDHASLDLGLSDLGNFNFNNADGVLLRAALHHEHRSSPVYIIGFSEK